MKKRIGIITILIIEFLLLGLYSLQVSMNFPSFFDPVINACEYFYQFVVLRPCMLFKLDSYSYGKLLTLFIINVIFIVLYYAIFCTIGAISKSKKRKKVYRVVKIPYELNEAEEERFSYSKYKKKFPLKRVISLIIPLSVIALFILVRFDVEFSTKVNLVEIGIFDTYTRYIDPIQQKVFNNTTVFNDFLYKIFTNDKHLGYADIVNKLPSSLSWIEYIILALLIVLILAVWFGLFTLLNLFFRKKRIERKVKKDREKYIFKKDYSAYKYRIKHANEYSSKSEKFMAIVENDDEENQIIADSKNTKKLKRENDAPEDYYDDLGHGVRDLGVGEVEKQELDKAKIEREVRYISDKDFDITLETEPVIEVVEEEEIDQIRQQAKEDELFYEKYQQDDVVIKDFENYSNNRQTVSDYVSMINEGEKNSEIENNDLTIKEEVKEVVEEPKEEVVYNEPVEKIEAEEKLINTENEVERIISPLERYRLQKQKEKEELLKERQKLIDEGNLTDENDPLKKYCKSGSRSGKVEERVPTIKEQEEEKRIKALERKNKRLSKK